jgi:hypothetical protein
MIRHCEENNDEAIPGFRLLLRLGADRNDEVRT